MVRTSDLVADVNLDVPVDQVIDHEEKTEASIAQSEGETEQVRESTVVLVDEETDIARVSALDEQNDQNGQDEKENDKGKDSDDDKERPESVTDMKPDFLERDTMAEKKRIYTKLVLFASYIVAFALLVHSVMITEKDDIENVFNILKFLLGLFGIATLSFTKSDFTCLIAYVSLFFAVYTVFILYALMYALMPIWHIVVHTLFMLTGVYATMCYINVASDYKERPETVEE